GERGIRTLGRVSPTHAFQACSLNHSDISPRLAVNSLQRRQNPQKPDCEENAKRLPLGTRPFSREPSARDACRKPVSLSRLSLLVARQSRHDSLQLVKFHLYLRDALKLNPQRVEISVDRFQCGLELVTGDECRSSRPSSAAWAARSRFAGCARRTARSRF